MITSTTIRSFTYIHNLTLSKRFVMELSSVRKEYFAYLQIAQTIIL